MYFKIKIDFLKSSYDGKTVFLESDVLCKASRGKEMDATATCTIPTTMPILGMYSTSSVYIHYKKVLSC